MAKWKNTLVKMNVREVSLVDDPACPGAVVILAKRGDSRETGGMDFEEFLKFDPSQPRDWHGRWTSFGASLRALGAQARTAASTAVRTITHSAVGTRVSRVQPVTGGGLHFEVHTPVKNGAGITTFVQIRPEHVAGNPKLERALDIAHKALLNFNVPQFNSYQGKGIFGMFRGSLPPSIFGGSQQSANAPYWDAGTKQWVRPSAPPSRTIDLSTATGEKPVGTGAGKPQPSADDLRAQQGQDHPENGYPINILGGRKTDSGLIVPLNAPGRDFNNSGGSAYIDTDGNFIPGGNQKAQEFIQNIHDTPGLLTKLPFATPETSNGAAYRTKEESDPVPPGSPEYQRGVELRYEQWNKNEKEITDFMRSMRPRTYSSENPRSSYTPSEERIHRENPFAFGKSLFKPAPSLFVEKSFNPLQARDQLGRWAAEGAKLAGEFARQLKSPGKLANLAAKGAAGATGLPDEIAEQSGHAIEHAVNAVVARVAAHPGFRQIVRGISRKVLRSPRLLFGKSRVSGLDLASRAALHRCIDDALHQITLPAGIAKSRTALLAIRQGAFVRLCSSVDRSNAA